MSRLLLLLVLIVYFIGVPAARAARRACRRSPGRRLWLTAASAVVLVGVGLAVPNLDAVIPDGMRESPAGLFPVIGAVIVLCVALVLAVSVLAGVALAGGGAPDDPPTRP